jgi:hypothetical protein
VLIQIGGRVMVRDGQVRSGKLTGVNGRYLVAGFFSMMGSWVRKTGDAKERDEARPPVGQPGQGQQNLGINCASDALDAGSA